MGTTVATYNNEIDKCTELKTIDDVASIVNIDPTKIKWDKKLFEHALKGVKHSLDKTMYNLLYIDHTLSNGYIMIKRSTGVSISYLNYFQLLGMTIC